MEINREIAPLASAELLRAEGLDVGSRIQVRLRSDRSTFAGVVHALSDEGLTIASRWWLPDPLALIPEPELIPWSDIDRAWKRGRAITHGLGWGLALSLLLGWCGSGMDRLTDGFPTHDGQSLGVGIGVLVGCFIILLGREWWLVYDGARPPADPDGEPWSG